MRAELGLSSEAFAVAVIGQITPWKGQYEAIQALAHLRHMNQDAQLLIVGEPKFVSVATRYDNRSYYADMQQLIAAEQLEACVHLLGERSDIPAIMGALDAVLVPSWEEPFGRVVIEAMALGLPVVAANVGGPAEIIRDGIDGLLVPPRDPQLWADAVWQLADSPELRARLGDAAALRARDFALPQHVAAMRQIYEETVASAVRH
jgi:glycosyltransferase involved in cell wall biosynthesis